MNKQPRTIKQLNSRLTSAYTEYFPYGKHKNKRPEDVVKTDPNYIVWWADTIVDFPLDPKIVREGERTYRQLPACGHWRGSIGPWDHWNDDGNEFDQEDWWAHPDAIAGDPWGHD